MEGLTLGDEVTRLIPKKLTLESSAKFWGGERDGGFSSGSSQVVEFEVPEGMGLKDFSRAKFEEKERLDLQILLMELSRGALSKKDYQHRKDLVKAYYDKLLGRENDDRAEVTEDSAESS